MTNSNDSRDHIMKARHCDECKHATVKWYEYKGPPAVLTCAKGHKPRHYMPRNAMDTGYGWKRVCGDFEVHNAKSEPTARLFAQVGSTDGLCHTGDK